MMTTHQPRRTLTLIGLTTINIVIQLVIAAVVKYSTIHTHLWVLVAVYVVVLALNVGRFVVWGIIHKHFPIGIAYASSALLFPAIVLMSYLYGEPVAWHHVLGVVLVMGGVVALVRDA